MTLQKTLDDIIKVSITPLLKVEKFKKSARNYYKQVDDDLGWCFNIQSSIYNDSEELSFTLNSGLFLPRAFSIYYNEPVPAFPKEYNCVSRVRIGQILGENDIWYTLKNSTNTNSLCDILRNHVQHFVLPHFHSFRSTDQFLDQNDNKWDHHTKIMIGILLYLRDRKEEGFNILHERIEVSENISHKNWLKDVINRLRA